MTELYFPCIEERRYTTDQIWVLPVGKALEAIAEKRGWIYNDRLGGDVPTAITPSDEFTILVNPFGAQFPSSKYYEFKKKRPNSRIIMIGGDTCYVPNYQDFDYGPIDYYLDPMMEVVNGFKHREFRSAHFWWSLSQWQIDEMKKCKQEEKQYNGICLVNRGPLSPDREKLLAGKSILSYLQPKLFDFHKLCELYSKCWAAIGTTTSCPGWGGNKRTMKGFRDWIAPFCGTVLIYDDYQDILNEFGRDGILPIYRYADRHSMNETIERLKNDPVWYSSLLTKQKEWAQAHTVDVQMEKVFEEII